MITLILLLISCATTKKNSVIVPEITFPDFPSFEGAKSISATETSVPNSWLFKLAEYKIQIEETEKNYTEIKKLYEVDE